MPSKRPQRTTAPGPLASAATRAWVSGTPRGLITRRGRGSLAGAVASTARASTSGRITMPGPPPAGVSSTERCLLAACARMSTASSVHRPAASALPARLTPSGPGNISGKMVRMVARHMMLNKSRCRPREGHPATRASRGPRKRGPIFQRRWLWVPACAGTTVYEVMNRIRHGSPPSYGIRKPLLFAPAVARRVFRRCHHDAPTRDVDAGHEGGGEWYHDGRSAGLRPQFQDVAGAESVNRRHCPDLGAVGGDGAKSDQIGMVELVGRRRRQTRARHEQSEIGEPLRRVTIADAAKARDQLTFGWAQCLDLEAFRAVFGRERPVVLHRHGIGGKRFELHLAAKAVRPADLGNADALRHVR